MTTHPIHGERTNHGIWFDESALQEPLEDPRQGINLLTCDVFLCDYSSIDALVSDNPIELTYHGGDGLWMCPTHWAEFYTYEPPRLTTYGAIMTGAKG